MTSEMYKVCVYTPLSLLFILINKERIILGDI